jgi:hypothetical protein
LSRHFFEKKISAKIFRARSKGRKSEGGDKKKRKSKKKGKDEESDEDSEEEEEEEEGPRPLPFGIGSEVVTELPSVFGGRLFPRIVGYSKIQKSRDRRLYPKIVAYSKIQKF